MNNNFDKDLENYKLLLKFRLYHDVHFYKYNVDKYSFCGDRGFTEFAIKLIKETHPEYFI